MNNCLVTTKGITIGKYAEDSKAGKWVFDNTVNYLN